MGVYYILTQNNENRPKTNRKNETLEGQPIDNRLTSDNAFSEQGLNNARVSDETIKKGNS
jgi:hypothetical protein